MQIQKSSHIRLFVGLPIINRAPIERVHAYLREHLEPLLVRYEACLKFETKMHLTLLFIGSVDQQNLDVVKGAMHSAAWAKPDIKLTLQGTSKAWAWGYTHLLLCEYYLLTGDEYVLPAIEAYSVAIAQGRDAAGLWGHRMADPDIDFERVITDPMPA